MSWADFYLLCFAVGFLFSLLSFLGGGVHGHLHLPHLPHAHAGAPVAAAPGAGAGARGGPSVFNFVTLAAFLAWFGGTGYLLTRFWTVWFALGLGIALLSGLIGGGAIYLFLSRVLMAAEPAPDAEDCGMVGALGRLSMPIREGGTGELIYSQGGTRRTCGARADHAGAALGKGSEVVVTRYEKGLAYVRLWEELAGEERTEKDQAVKRSGL